jgi:hypothetical protein
MSFNITYTGACYGPHPEVVPPQYAYKHDILFDGEQLDRAFLCVSAKRLMVGKHCANLRRIADTVMEWYGGDVFLWRNKDLTISAYCTSTDTWMLERICEVVRSRIETIMEKLDVEVEQEELEDEMEDVCHAIEDEDNAFEFAYDAYCDALDNAWMDFESELDAFLDELDRLDDDEGRVAASEHWFPTAMFAADVSKACAKVEVAYRRSYIEVLMTGLVC